jgi:hypothetical protein
MYSVFIEWGIFLCLSLSQNYCSPHLVKAKKVDVHRLVFAFKKNFLLVETNFWLRGKKTESKVFTRRLGSLEPNWCVSLFCVNS